VLNFVWKLALASPDMQRQAVLCATSEWLCLRIFHYLDGGSFMASNEQGKKLFTVRSLTVIVVVLTALTIGLVLVTRSDAQKRSVQDDAQKRSFPDQDQAVQSKPSKKKLRNFDAEILENANDLLEDGRDTFRFDTFGDEVFWGGALQLHQAIKGANLGGVGPGISPSTALGLGLKVDESRCRCLASTARKQTETGAGRSKRSGDNSCAT
jgi:hypothetical protein